MCVCVCVCIRQCWRLCLFVFGFLKLKSICLWFPKTQIIFLSAFPHDKQNKFITVDQFRFILISFLSFLDFCWGGRIFPLCKGPALCKFPLPKHTKIQNSSSAAKRIHRSRKETRIAETRLAEWLFHFTHTHPRTYTHNTHTHTHTHITHTHIAHTQYTTTTHNNNTQQYTHVSLVPVLLRTAARPCIKDLREAVEHRLVDGRLCATDAARLGRRLLELAAWCGMAWFALKGFDHIQNKIHTLKHTPTQTHTHTHTHTHLHIHKHKDVNPTSITITLIHTRTHTHTHIHTRALAAGSALLRRRTLTLLPLQLQLHGLQLAAQLGVLAHDCLGACVGHLQGAEGCCVCVCVCMCLFAM